MQFFKLAAIEYKDPEALNELGVMYEQGLVNGTPDYEKVSFFSNYNPLTGI